MEWWEKSIFEKIFKILFISYLFFIIKKNITAGSSTTSKKIKIKNNNNSRASSSTLDLEQEERVILLEDKRIRVERKGIKAWKRKTRDN